MYNVPFIVGLNNGGKSTIHVLGLRHIYAFSQKKRAKVLLFFDMTK